MVGHGTAVVKSIGPGSNIGTGVDQVNGPVPIGVVAVVPCPAGMDRILLEGIYHSGAVICCVGQTVAIPIGAA